MYSAFAYTTNWMQNERDFVMRREERRGCQSIESFNSTLFGVVEYASSSSALLQAPMMETVVVGSSSSLK